MLTFTVSTAPEARAAAAACIALAAALDAGNTPAAGADEVQPDRTPRRGRTAAPAQADPVVAYNALAAVAGAAQVAGVADPAAEAAAPVALTPAVTLPPAAEAAAPDMTALRNAVRSGAVELGVAWVRDNLMAKYSVPNVSAMTDAQVVEAAAAVKSALAAKGGPA